MFRCEALQRKGPSRSDSMSGMRHAFRRDTFLSHKPTFKAYAMGAGSDPTPIFIQRNALGQTTRYAGGFD